MVFNIAVAAAAALSGEFNAWKATNGVRYESQEMHAYKEHIYKLNKALVEEHNAEFARGRESYELELNKFADMTASEFGALFSRPRTKRSADYASATHVSNETAPESMDWRDVKNVVGPVKNQGSCGSCWAFSAVAAMEGAYNYKMKDQQDGHVSFSEQELVDCTNDGAYTCKRGGEMSDGIEEIVKDHHGKINTEKEYPYTGTSKKGSCNADDSDAVSTGITGFTAVPKDDEDALKHAAAKHVISVGVDASSPRFQLYKSGIYAPFLCSSTNLDHGVAVVGYGTGEKGDYWIVRNSWGETWGEDGYFMLARNDKNKCGIAADAVYATI